MKVINFEIEIPKYRNWTEIAILGDIHYGNEFFDEKLWNKYYIGGKGHIGFRDDQNMYVICIGDLMETALKDSKGVQDQSEWIEDQYLWVKNVLTPIKDDGRLIALVEGNHEKRATRNWIRTTRLLSKELNIPYSHGYMIINIILKKGDKRRLYKIAVHHGYGWARSRGGQIGAVERMIKVVADADVYVMGHLHNKFAIPTAIYRGDEIVEVLIGMTGAYLSYGGYVEDKLYPPPARGSLKLKLHFDINRVSGR